MARVVELGCGLGNRLYSMSNELKKTPNTTFIWAPDVGLHFSESANSTITTFEDLFIPAQPVSTLPVSGPSAVNIRRAVRPPEAPFFQYPANNEDLVAGENSSHEWRNVELLTIYNFEKRYRRHDPVACCVCPGSTLAECTPFLQSLRPPPVLLPALLRLQRLLPQNSTVLHLRNDLGDFDQRNRSINSSVVHQLALEHFDYAAVERPEDAHVIRKFSPRTMLQSDFRHVAYGRSSTESHQAAVFELFAISMARTLRMSQESSFNKLARCLRMPPLENRKFESRY